MYEVRAQILLEGVASSLHGSKVSLLRVFWLGGIHCRFAAINLTLNVTARTSRAQSTAVLTLLASIWKVIPRSGASTYVYTSVLRRGKVFPLATIRFLEQVSCGIQRKCGGQPTELWVGAEAMHPPSCTPGILCSQQSTGHCTGGGLAVIPDLAIPSLMV